jgi:hypothetical protein
MRASGAATLTGGFERYQVAATFEVGQHHLYQVRRYIQHAGQFRQGARRPMGDVLQQFR